MLYCECKFDEGKYTTTVKVKVSSKSRDLVRHTDHSIIIIYTYNVHLIYFAIYFTFVFFIDLIIYINQFGRNNFFKTFCSLAVFKQKIK